MINKTCIIIFSSLVFAACCTGSSISREGNIPEQLQVKAEEFIISKTGEAFFDKNIQPDFKKTIKINDGYLMVYNFFIPDKEIEGVIRFSIDTLGNVNRDKEIVGIPDCKLNPGDCLFSISKKEAVNIAASSGLDKGVKEWNVKFTWNMTHNKYLWDITSTLKESKGNGFHRAAGKTLLIDPNSGEIIDTNQWQIN
jgi:hypothetical protein